MDTAWLAQLRGRLEEQEVDLDQVLRELVSEATRHLRADRGTLYLVDHARNELVSRVARLEEIAEIRLRIGEGIAGTVAAHGQAVVVSEGQEDPRLARRFDEMTGYRTRSVAAVPVLNQNNGLVGVLQLLNKADGDFEASDVAALSTFAKGVAEALGATSLRSQLHPGLRQPLSFRFNHIVGESSAMQRVYDRTARAAATDATVLVHGESGTGKELIARAVHYNSERSDKPFVKVDCAALPEGLIENELFGHERGAFTGADRSTEGKVAAARGGTLFLDEIGELPLSVQGKLLRLLQDHTFYRVGGTTPQKASVRFVAATNRSLTTEVSDGRFRQDLYYRLRVVEIALPPLRARGGGDLDRLIDHFLYELTTHHKRPRLTLSEGARAELHAHPWPGNVRELRHVLESAVVLTPGDFIGAEQLSLDVEPPTPLGVPVGCFIPDGSSLRDAERRFVLHTLDQHDGNRSHAADALGIGRNTLLRKLKEWGEV